MKQAFFSLVLTAVLAGQNAYGADAPWPEMQEFDVQFVVHANADKIEFIRPLKDLQGKVKYVFVCKGGSDEHLEALSEQAKISYFGQLGCRLSEGDKEAEASLLSEDAGAPWHSRGQYHSFEEVIGPCGNYPEYGRLRHFRLRGFELTLLALEPVFNKQDLLESFKLKVTLRRDAKITASRAEESGYKSPYKGGRSCGVVERSGVNAGKL